MALPPDILQHRVRQDPWSVRVHEAWTWHQGVRPSCRQCYLWGAHLPWDVPAVHALQGGACQPSSHLQHTTTTFTWVNQQLVVWRSGNALSWSMKLLYVKARLVLARVTICRWVNHQPSQYITSHQGQLSLAIPLWVGIMCTSKSW